MRKTVAKMIQRLYPKDKTQQRRAKKSWNRTPKPLRGQLRKQFAR